MTENIPKKAGGNQDFRRQAHSYCMVTAKKRVAETGKAFSHFCRAWI
jgi:hypothetical protein